MALREIITVPHPVLKRKAKPVKDFGDDLQILIDDMVETMRDAPGVGLAAPQIGISQRVMVVEFGDEEDLEAPKKLYTLVNPEITRKEGELVLGAEGCLSVPGLMGDVYRNDEITVKAQTRRGQNTKLKLKGWTARIFQHEYDHLEGVIFTEIAERVYEPVEPEALEELSEAPPTDEE